MATHSTVLAWRIPGTESLVDCHLWGCTESATTEVTQQQQQQPYISVSNSCAVAGDMGQEDSLREGNGNLLRYSCLGNPMDRGLVGQSPWGHRRVRHNLATEQQPYWTALFWALYTKVSFAAISWIKVCSLSRMLVPEAFPRKLVPICKNQPCYSLLSPHSC